MRTIHWLFIWLCLSLSAGSSRGLEIFRPKAGVTEFSEPGQPFGVEILAPAGLSSNGWSVILGNDLRAWSNSVVEQVDYGLEVYNRSLVGYRLQVRTPSEAPPELFSLEVRHAAAGAATNRRAVSLAPVLETNFYLLHYADPQISGSNALSGSGQNSPYGSLQELSWHAPVFSLINPRFIFNTGDEIDDGDVDTANRYAAYLNAIAAFGPPLLITRGNNDRGDFGHWKTNVGQAAYSLTMGSFYLCMNDTRGNEMRAWFTNDYAAAFADSNIAYRLIGQHYNSNGDGKNPYFFAPTAGQYPDLMLVGHNHSFSTLQSSPYPVLSSGPACNYGGASLLTFYKSGSNWLCPGAASHPAGTRFNAVGDWGAPHVACAYRVANDGAACSNTVVITNSLPFDFWDGRVRFHMRSARYGYVVTGGAVLAQYDYAGGSNTAVLVQVDIRSNRLTTVSIARTDSDQDEMPDAWELAWFGDLTTATNTTDYDEDAWLDWQEYAADTDPTRAASFLRLEALQLDAGLQRLAWTGGTGVFQYLEMSANLFSNDWKLVYTNTPPTSVSNSFNVLESLTNSFYRIRAVR